MPRQLPTELLNFLTHLNLDVEKEAMTLVVTDEDIVLAVRLARSQAEDDGADDTGEVAGGEGDTELRRLAVRLLGRGEDVGVEQLDDLLEEEELGHGVGDLRYCQQPLPRVHEIR